MATKQSKNKPSKCDISVVLDRSGSMESIKDDTIGGFNTFLEAQKKVKGECSISLYQFDDKYEEVYEGKDIQDAPKLTKETFVPRGWTALLDALGRTINNTETRISKLPAKQRPDKVIFVLQSDGAENASKEFTKEKIFELIKSKREKNKWEFVFLGANQDAITVAGSYGIAKDSTLTYAGTAKGTSGAYGSLNNAVTFFRSAVNCSSVNFTDNDRKLQEEELTKV